MSRYVTEDLRSMWHKFDSGRRDLRCIAVEDGANAMSKPLEIKIGYGGDCINPTWPSRLTKHVHDWRGYVTADLRSMWHTFDSGQKVAIAAAFEIIAQAEEWD